MPAAIVVFDTSYWRKAKLAQIEAFYPRGSWVWAVTGTTDLELGDTNQEEHEVEARKRRLAELVEHRVRTLLPDGFVHSFELLCVHNGVQLPPDFPLENGAYQEFRWAQIRLATDGGGPHPLLVMHVRQKEKQIDSIWERMPKGENGVSVITEEKLQRAVEAYLDPRIPLPFHHVPFGIIVAGLGAPRIRDECPAIMNFLRVNAFYDLLVRPAEARAGFTIEYQGDRFKVEVSTIADLKIGATPLPYIGQFVTSDKGQAKLLAALFPKHKDKIVYRDADATDSSSTR